VQLLESASRDIHNIMQMVGLHQDEVSLQLNVYCRLFIL